MNYTPIPNSKLTLVVDARLSKYVAIKDDKFNLYPVKRIAKPGSRYSTAHYFKADSPLALSDNFKPKFEIDPSITGVITYQVFDNTFIIPKDLSYSPKLI